MLHRLFITTFALLICLTFNQISLGQDRQPTTDFKFANSYVTGSIDSVNVSNGNVVLNLPLASLPKGRGTSPGAVVTLQYNSKLWASKQVNHSNIIQQTNGDQIANSGTYSFYEDKLVPSDQGGWRLLFGYHIRWTNRLNLESPDPCGRGDSIDKLAAKWKLEMLFPDGVVRELIPITSYTSTLDGYYNVDFNGVGYSAVTQSNPANGICFPSETFGQMTTNGMTYISTDGSRIRLFVPYVPNSSPDEASLQSRNWKLYYLDGTVIENKPADDPTVWQRETDKNGNKVDYKNNQIVDQLGRSITLSNTINSSSISVQGVGGETLTTQINWGNKYVYRRYMTIPIDQVLNVPPGTLLNYLTIFGETIRTVDQIILPAQAGGQSYSFEYYADNNQPSGTNFTNGWGEVKSVNFPTGAKATFTYLGQGSFDPGTGLEMRAADVLAIRATQKELTYTEEYDGVQTPRSEKTLYEGGFGGATVTAPNGSITSELSFNFINGGWSNGLAYRNNNSDGSFSERIWKRNLPNNLPEGAGNANAYVKTEFSTVADAGGQPFLTAIKDFNYDKNGNVTQIKEYDWVAYSSVPRTNNQPTGIPSGLVPKRITVNEYYNQTPDAESTAGSPLTYENSASPKLKNLIKSTTVTDGNNNVVSRSEFFYDDPDNKGNLVESKVWDSSKGAYSNPLNTGNSISTTVQYDIYGNPVQTTDAKGVVSTMTYGAITSPSGSVTGLYPTQVVSAVGTPQQRTATSTYDFYTGLTKTSTDVDNGVTNETVYDAIGRPLISKAAINTANEIWTQMEYNDQLRRVVSRSDLFVKGDGKKVAIQHYDQLGRVRLSRTLEDATTQNPYNEADGVKVQTRYRYDNGANPSTSNGIYSLKSNPYRAATAAQATNEETMGWEREYEDKTGNLEISESFAGVDLPAPWGNNLNSTGVSRSEEVANATTVTDQAGKKNRRITDSLGRLVRVDEPNDNNDLGSVSSPVQPTNYVYDAIGNLTQIIQGGQTRNFAYNSLNRLIQSTNPESGTFQFSYDNNGNLLTKTDARGISTTYSYDAANRVTFRDYSDATPDVSYFYDDAQIPFSKGKLTKVSSSVSETKITGFDSQERVISSQQVVDGQSYNFGYQYNLSGALVSQTLPSGRVVTNAYDNGGDLAQVGGIFGGQNKIYADNFSYTAHEQVASVRLGNNRWETTKFNSVMQITQVGLGTSTNDTSLWRADYIFGTWENGSINQQKNNNSVAQQTIIVPNNAQSAGFTATQTYLYDSLDRVKSAQETTANGLAWKQTFVYDRFGNRNFDVPNSTLQSIESNVPKIANPEILQSNNQYKQDQDNDGQPDYLYDPSGNITKDAQNRDFTYDAENRQITAVGNNLSVSYAYDGNDKRVKSFNAITNQTTIYVYDADGDLAAEYLVTSATSQNPTTSYLTEDALGSPRVISDQNGEVKARRDFLPFGEEIYAGVGSRNIAQKYSPNDDRIRQKFTGYQRDVETKLDYAQSRYYSSLQGRFTSPDEFKGGPDELFDFEDDASDNPTFYADLGNPQSLNKYQYTYNNPYKYTDPTGHCPPVPLAIPCAIGRSPAGQKIGEGLATVGRVIVAGAVAGAEWVTSTGGNSQPQLTRVVDSISTRPQKGQIYRKKGNSGEGGKNNKDKSAKKEKRVPGGSPGSRIGKSFTKKGKEIVIERAKDPKTGKIKCNNCGVTTVKPKKSKSGVTPNPRERQVDHIRARSKGGSGTPENGQVLCRGCNRTKSDNEEE